MSKLIYLSIALLLLLGNRVSAKLLNDSAIKGRLINGFSYVITKTNIEKHKADIRLIIKAGFFNEKPDQYQASHMLEHVLLATPCTDRNISLHQYLRSYGLILGRDYNASTGFVETIYTFNVSTIDGKIILGILDFFRSWMNGNNLVNSVISVERGVIASEAKLAQATVEGRLMRQYLMRILEGSSIAKLYEEENPLLRIGQLTKQKIVSFYSDWYHAGQALLVVTGDVNVSLLNTQIKRMFAELNAKTPRQISYLLSPLPTHDTVMLTTDSLKKDVDLQAVFKFRRINKKNLLASTKEALIFQLVNKMLARRYQKAKNTTSSLFPIMNANEYFIGRETGLGAFLSRVTLESTDSLKPAVVRMFQEIKRLKQYGFLAAELTNAKEILKKEIQQHKATNSEITENYIAQFLDNELSSQKENENSRPREMLSDLTIEEINDKLLSWLKDANYELVISASSQNYKLLADIASITEWIDTAKSVTVSVPEFQPPRSLSAQICLYSGSPTIKKVNIDKAMGLWQLNFQSGIQVLLRPIPEDSSVGKIYMRAFTKRKGNINSNFNRMAEEAAEYVVANSGVGTLNREELLDIMDNHKISVTPYINETFAGFEGIADTGQLEQLLQLLWLYIHAPRYDSSASEYYLQQQRLRSVKANSEDEKIKAVFDFDTRSSSHLKIPGPNLEEVISAYKNVVANFDNLTFVFSGNLNIDYFKNRLLKYITDIPMMATGSVMMKVPASDSNFIFPVKRCCKSSAIKNSANIKLKFLTQFNLSAENTLIASIVQRILQARLQSRLRDREGLVYYVNTSIYTRRYPVNYVSAEIQFYSELLNKDKLITAVLDEIDRLKQVGPMIEELNRGRIEEINKLKKNFLNPAFWVNYLETQIKNGGDIHDIVNYSTIIKNIDVSTIKLFVSKYLSKCSYYQVELSQ